MKRYTKEDLKETALAWMVMITLILVSGLGTHFIDGI